jgi:hypothetical protein
LDALGEEELVEAGLGTLPGERQWADDIRLPVLYRELLDVSTPPGVAGRHASSFRRSTIVPITPSAYVNSSFSGSASPAGHPDLVNTRWAHTGHPCLIPGSMLDGAAILFPEPGASRSGCSVNHGSGRHMGRGEAKRELAALQDEIDREMATIERTLGGVRITRIVGNTERTPLDECGHAYKSLDEVLGVLEAEGIARVAHRLFPVAKISESQRIRARYQFGTSTCQRLY